MIQILLVKISEGPFNNAGTGGFSSRMGSAGDTQEWVVLVNPPTVTAWMMSPAAADSPASP